MEEINRYDKPTFNNNHNKTMIAEELRRYYSELKDEVDENDDRQIAKNFRKLIRKIWIDR